jgi:nucleotide-binding universal stress UspA family protein
MNGRLDAAAVKLIHDWEPSQVVLSARRGSALRRFIFGSPVKYLQREVSVPVEVICES